MRAEIAEKIADSTRILIIPHAHADLDAIGSALGLAKTLDSEVAIARPDGIQSNAANLLESDDLLPDPCLDNYDLLIVVDAPSRARIAPYDPIAASPRCIVIDHHEPGDVAANADLAYVDTSAPATSSLVAHVLEAGMWAVPETAAVALVAGILDDTGFRAVIGRGTYEQTTRLLEQAGEARAELTDIWQTSTDWSERMATAKALVRANGYKAGQTIVLTTTVGGEETAAAHALLAGNADVAIVVSPRNDHTRVVARTSDTLDADFSLPEAVLEPLAREFGGDGGGHSGAGVAKLETIDGDAVETRTVSLLGDSLDVQFGELS
jgi:nanoRNase/pAp phosphatase (c-di-AMP/oligoRNAs hydrolase)